LPAFGAKKIATNSRNKCSVKVCSSQPQRKTIDLKRCQAELVEAGAIRKRVVFIINTPSTISDWHFNNRYAAKTDANF
jgi:hypothetical protein